MTTALVERMECQQPSNVAQSLGWKAESPASSKHAAMPTPHGAVIHVAGGESLSPIERNVRK
jgi:hypothetical protein